MRREDRLDGPEGDVFPTGRYLAPPSGAPERRSGGARAAQGDETATDAMEAALGAIP